MQLQAKIKILLAEDEPVLRRGILAQIERLDHDFLVVGESDNGVQALEKMQAETPDVLFTDIKMPEMDGVELVRQARLRYPKVKSVILSGYSDFSYMQQAIRYGVSHYLLKPVTDDALRDVLLEIKNEVLTEQYQPKRTVIRSANYHERMTNLSYLLFSACAGNLCYDVSDAYMQEFFAKSAPLDWESVMAGAAPDMVDWHVSDEDAANQKLIVCRVKKGSQPDCAQIAQTLQSRISARLDGTPVTICYSRLALSQDEVWVSSQRLRNLLHQCLVPARASLFCLERDELRSTEEILNIVKMRINDQLRQAIERNDTDQIRAELEMIFKYLANHAVSQRDMQKIITYILRLCELSSVAGAEGSYKKIMRALCCTHDEKELAEVLVSVLLQNVWQEEAGGDLGAQLVDYVDRHFIQLEQLESITETFHYNYAYLSRLFKKQTGVSLNKYVLEKRLNLAKQLIENNEALNVAQIAALSGFSDRRYFLRAFKAYTNQSPSEYKNSIILKG